MPPANPRHTDLSLLLLRLGFGGTMLLAHGWPKLAKLLAGDTSFADPLGIGPTASLVLAIMAEALAATLVMLGLFTRAALIPLMITMFVAAFVHHAGDPFAQQEKALLFLVAFAALFVSGPGRYALQHALARGRQAKNRVLAFLLG